MNDVTNIGPFPGLTTKDGWTRSGQGLKRWTFSLNLTILAA